MNLLKRSIRLLSSKIFLFWLVTAWMFYYVSLSIWSKEAFAGFVAGLNKNPLIQIPYAVFLLSLLLNIVRSSRGMFKQGILKTLIWMFLPSGILVFFMGFFMSSSLRHWEWRAVGEGDSIRGYTVMEIKPALKEETLQMESDEGLFQYEPKVILSRDGMNYEVGAFPPKGLEGTYFHILNFGLAPGVRLQDKTRILDEGYVMLRILPPGAEDTFQMPPYPYRFSLRIAPERVIRKGSMDVKVYSLKSPAYEAVVYKGEDIIFEGPSQRGVSFNDLTLTFFKPAYWVLLEVVKDPGVMVLVTGLCLIAIGLSLRAFYITARIIGLA